MPNAKQRELRAQRRTAMIELALDLIAEGGLKECSFRNLAKRSGTTVRPFTYEFGTMATLLGAVALEAWSRLGFTLGETVEPGDDPVATLYELCSRAVPLNGTCDPAMRCYAELTFHAVEDPLLAEALTEADRQGAPVYQQLVRAAQASGRIAPGRDPEDVVAALWAVCDGLLLATFLHPGYFTRDRLERVWRQSFDAIIGADS